MKRLSLFVFTLILGTGLTFAQSNSASTSATGNDNSATVTQTGASNEATTTQDGNDNEATTTQTGDNNKATIDQGKQGTTSNNDVAVIEQVGNGNTASLSGRDGFGTSSASVLYAVYQYGNDNNVNARAFNAPSEANIDQIGNSNDADVLQTRSDDMFIDLVQDGSDNIADLVQNNSDNSVLQASFEGSSNEMYVTQSNGAWQKLVLDVVGSSNFISGTLGAHDADQFTTILGDGNTFNFYQDKSSDAGIFVEGNDNQITMMQNGTGNKVFAVDPWDRDGIVIDGSDNTVLVTQNSDFNTAVVNMVGNSNSATVTQN